MIVLEDFQECDFDRLKTWVQNEEQLVRFAGTLFEYPLDRAQLEHYLFQEELKPKKVMLAQTREVVGHCEFNSSSGAHRLSRILIAETHRGKGIGRQVVEEMSRCFFEDPSVMELDLFVFSHNLAAIQCYERVGFSIDTSFAQDLIVGSNTWPRLRMVLGRDHWSTHM